jgi:hypothetical protein
VVTIPPTLTQPWQLGWQATQPNFIGILRSSRVAVACAAQRNGATSEARQSTAVPSNAKQRKSDDLKSLKLVPSPSPSSGPASPTATSVDSIYHTRVTKMVSGGLPIVHSELPHCHQIIGKVWHDCRNK